jgi:hypothetical protein
MRSLTQTEESNNNQAHHLGNAFTARTAHFDPKTLKNMVAQDLHSAVAPDSQASSWSPWLSLQFGPNYGASRQDRAGGEALFDAEPPTASPLSVPHGEARSRMGVNISREGASPLSSSSDSDMFNDWGDHGLIGGDDLTSPSLAESGETRRSRKKFAQNHHAFCAAANLFPEANHMLVGHSHWVISNHRSTCAPGAALQGTSSKRCAVLLLFRTKNCPSLQKSETLAHPRVRLSHGMHMSA